MARIRHALSILALLAPACGQDEATIEYSVNGPDPAVAVYQLDTFAVIDGRPDSSSSTADEDPLPFPQEGAVGWFDDDARSGASVQICAVAQGTDVMLAAVSTPVRLVVNETVEVSLTLAALAEGDDVPAPCDMQ